MSDAIDKNIEVDSNGGGIEKSGHHFQPEPTDGLSSMMLEEAIVNPVVNRNSPQLGACAILVSAGPDLKRLVQLCNGDALQRRSLYMSRMFMAEEKAGPTIVGPVLGAPYAAMVLETLAAWGVRQVVYLGWCGSLTGDLAIGDILVASGAFADEGTSRHYNGQWEADAEGIADNGPWLSRASDGILRSIRRVFQQQGSAFQEGTLWTTDGVYRETVRKVEYYRRMGALAVEMEISALYAVGVSRGLDIGAVVVVSDNLSSHTWKPGFSDRRFIQGREQALSGLKELAAVWTGRGGEHDG